MTPFEAATLRPKTQTLYPLHQNHYEHMNFIPSDSLSDAEKRPMTQLPTSYLPTFSVEWLGESDRIAKDMGIPRNSTETWNTYCKKILETNVEVYRKLKTECEEVLRTELEIKDRIESFMSTLIKSGGFNNTETIKGLHETLIPHIQKLRTLQPLLDNLGIDTKKIFTELGSSVDIIDGKIKEKGTATDVTSATDLFFLYVVKSCVGKLTTEDKLEIKKLRPLLSLDDKTINLFLRSSNSAENLVAIHSIEVFVQDTLEKDNILEALHNFRNLKTVASFEKLIQMYVTIESYGSTEQKEFVRDNLKLKDIIMRTIDANLEIQKMMEKDPNVKENNRNPNLTSESIEKHAKEVFFVSVENCNEFFEYYLFLTLNLPEDYYDLEKKKNTCKYILSPKDSVKTFTSEKNVLETFYRTPSVDRLISSVIQQSYMIASPNSFPNWPSYVENVYSRGLKFTQSSGEMKWIACNMSESIKAFTLIDCTLNEFEDNKEIAENMISSFNEIVLNLDSDSRFPALALSVLSSVGIYITKFDAFKGENPEIPENLKPKMQSIQEFVKRVISFKYEHIQPNELGMNIIVNILQKSKVTLPSDYSKFFNTFTIIQMEDFIITSYKDKKISISLYSETLNIISVTKIYQNIWETKVKTPLTQQSAENLNVQGLYKLTNTDLKENVGKETFRKLRQGRTDIALSNEFFSKNKIVPTNSKVYDSLLTGIVTHEQKQLATKAYAGSLRTSGGLIASKNFPLLIQEQGFFDKKFTQLSNEIYNAALNKLEWKIQANLILKLLSMYEKVKDDNLVDISEEQNLTISKYVNYVLFTYKEQLQSINSMSQLIKLRSEIYSLTNDGTLPIMNEITLLLHFKYLELSPNNYQTDYSDAHEIVSSKFPTSDQNLLIVISSYWAVQGIEELDVVRTYIQETEDSPLKIANRLFLISKKSLNYVPLVYDPIDSESNFIAAEVESKEIDFINIHMMFNHYIRLLEYCVTVSHNEDKQIEFETYVEETLGLYINNNYKKDKLTLYTEILGNPYVYNNPSIKDFCVTTITKHLNKDSLPENFQDLTPQYWEGLAVVQLGGNVSNSLISLVTDRNIETFALTALNSWPKPSLLRNEVFALSYDMNEVDDFLKGSYNASDVKNEHFSTEPPPPDNWISITHNNSETSFFNNSKNDSYPEFPEFPETPAIIPGNELTVSFDKETLKFFFQKLLSDDSTHLSLINQERTINYLWRTNPNENFVIEVMDFISHNPSFGKLSFSIQETMIKKITKTLLKWMEMMVIDNIDYRDQMINLLLTRELIVGELGDVIIDLALGCLYSIRSGKKNVDLPSFAVAMHDFFKVRNKNYDVTILPLYIRRCFLMYTSIPGLVWNSDEFFRSVFQSYNIDKFFDKLAKIDGSASTEKKDFVIKPDTSGLSIADQNVILTRGRAQTSAELSLKDLNFELHTYCLNPIGVLTLDFLLSKNSNELTDVEKRYKDIGLDCQRINIKKLVVIKSMPVTPINMFDVSNIEPILNVTSAKIDFVRRIQTLRTEIETTEPISTKTIEGIINSTIEELQFLSSDPSYPLVNSNFTKFQTTFAPLLDKRNVIESKIQTGIAEAEFVLITTGMLEETYKLSLLDKFKLLNQTLVEYREVHQEMTVVLYRFTSALKTGNITLGYSMLEQSTLTMMAKLKVSGDLEIFELTQANRAEIEKELETIGETYRSVDCFREIKAIQEKLSDKSYVISDEIKKAFQSQIDLMTPSQTKIKNNNAFVLIQSEINILLTRFDDINKEYSISYSLTDLLTTQTSIITLFDKFDGDKTDIQKYELETKNKMQTTISLYRSSIKSLETELDKQKSAANSTLDKVKAVISTAESKYTQLLLPDLKQIKTQFDSDVKLIKAQKTSLNDLLGKIQGLTGEEKVLDIAMSFDDSGVEARSKLLGTIITDKETLLVSDMKTSTETAYVKAEGFLVGVMTHMTSVPLTPDTKEVNYNDIYKDFNTSYVSFETTATLELDSYNGMTYIIKNSPEITTRHEIKKKALQSSLKNIEDIEVPAFNLKLGYFKTMTSLYVSAKQKMTAWFKPNENGVKPTVNLNNTDVLYSELTSIGEELLKIPGIIVLEETFTNDILEVEKVRTSLTSDKTRLKNEVTRIESEIKKSDSINVIQTKTEEYITTLTDLFAITGSNQYNETHSISGMTQTATSYLTLEKSRFEAQVIAEKHISEQQEEIVRFLTGVQKSVQTNNVTESALKIFFKQMEKYTGFLSSDEKGEEWNSNVFNPLYATVFSGMSFLNQERTVTVIRFEVLNDFKIKIIDPLLAEDTMDVVVAEEKLQAGRELLKLCKTDSKLKLSEETIRKESEEVQLATTALDKLSSRVNDKIMINAAVNEINTILGKYNSEKKPTLVFINRIIEEINEVLSYDVSNPEFTQFNDALENISNFVYVLRKNIAEVTESVNSIKDSIKGKQSEFDEARKLGDLELMQQIFGKIETQKSDYGDQLQKFVQLTQSAIFESQDTGSMFYTASQQSIDNEAAIKSLSDIIRDDDIIETRVANAEETTAAETAVFNYFSSFETLIDDTPGKIRNEDIRLFQNNETLNSLLGNVKTAQNTETQYITENKLTTKEDGNDPMLVLEPKFKIFNTTITGTQQRVGEKMRVLIQNDQERNEKIKNLNEFVTVNIDPLLAGGIKNLTTAITNSENAKNLLKLIPPPVISRDASFEEVFNALSYSQKFVQLDTNILGQATENVKTELEIKRQEDITTSFSAAEVLTNDVVSIQSLNQQQSISLLPKITTILQNLNSLNISKVSGSPYVELKNFETELIAHIKSNNDAKSLLVIESTTVFFEIGALQTRFNSNKTDVTRIQIHDTTDGYIATLNKIDRISGENTYETRIEELKKQLAENDVYYVAFVESERKNAIDTRDGSDTAVNEYFLLINTSVDNKNITRLQLNQYVSESQRLYQELDKSVQSEIYTIKLNKLPKEDDASLSSLTKPPTTLLTTRTSQKDELDIKVNELKSRDSVRSDKIKALKKTSSLSTIFITPVKDSDIKNVYDFYTKFSSDTLNVGDPEVIDDPSSELSVYMSTTIKSFLKTYEDAISISKNSITGWLLENTPESFSKSGLSSLIETAKVFGDKFAILGQITTDEEKSEKSYLTINGTESNLLEEIDNKRDTLQRKTTEADRGFNKTNADSDTFIQNYETPKKDFQLNVMKSIATNLTSSIEFTLSDFQEINKLNGTDSNSGKIELLETRNQKIQEIVLREESRDSLVLKFGIGTAHNLTTSSQSEFSAYVSYWRNGIKNKNITTDDGDPLLVSKKFEEKKGLVLEAFDSEIKIDSANANATRIAKLSFLSESETLNTALQSEIGEFITRESERKQKNKEYQQFILSEVTPLIRKQFDVKSANVVYKKGLDMFGNLTKSEIKENKDDPTAEKLNELNTAIVSRNTSISAVVGDIVTAKDALLTATAKISVPGKITYGVFGMITQSQVTETKTAIVESRTLLDLYVREIIKLENLYDIGASVESITAFRETYNVIFLKLNTHEFTNNECQSFLDKNEAKKQTELSTLTTSVETQSTQLITNPAEKFDIATETAKVKIYKRDVDKIEKLMSDKNLAPSMLFPYNEKHKQATSAIDIRTQTLNTLKGTTSNQYTSTKSEIGGLLPPTIKFLGFFETNFIPEDAFNDDYFLGIGAKVASAGSSLETLRITAKIEIEEQSPNSKRTSELQTLLQTLETDLSTKTETIEAARIEFAAEKLAKEQEKLAKEQEKKQKDIEEVKQTVASFGVAFKISEFGIDNSSALIRTCFNKLSGLDPENTEVKKLREQVVAISGKIVSAEHTREELNRRIVVSDLKISDARNKMSDDDSDENFALKSKKLSNLCDTAIGFKEKLNILEPNEENTQSILSLQGLKDKLVSEKVSREQSKEALRIFNQSKILTGFGTTLQGQIQVLNKPFDNSSQFDTVLTNLEMLGQNVNKFISANVTQQEETLTLASNVEAAKTRCNSEKLAFDDVQTKLANINGLFVLPYPSAMMGYEEVCVYRVTLTSTYDTFIIANNFTANKYTKETDVSNVISEYESLVTTLTLREETLDNAYTRFNNSSSLVNTMVQTLNDEHIQSHNITLGDNAYLVRVKTELSCLEEFLEELQNSKSSLVGMLGSSDTKENERILETDKSVIAVLTDLRGWFNLLNTTFELLNENNTKEYARNQRIETITGKFNRMYNSSFPMDPSKIILEGSGETLDALCTEISNLRAEKADDSLIADFEDKYLKYYSVLTNHRDEIETAKSNLSSSKVAVNNKLGEIEIIPVDEVAYIESFENNVEEIESLLKTTQTNTHSLNDVMNEYDGPKETLEYVASIKQRLQVVKEKEKAIRENREIKKIELERKTTVDTWFQNLPVIIQELIKVKSPPVENLFTCNLLKTNIETEYGTLDNLKPTNEEKAKRNAQMKKDLEPLNEKIGKLDTEKKRLEDNEKLLSTRLENNLKTPHDFSTKFQNVDLTEIETTLKDYYEISNQLKNITGEIIADVEKEGTVKDAENMFRFFKKRQVEILRHKVEEEQKSAVKSIGDLGSSSITKLDEVDGYRVKLTISQTSLTDLKIALDSYYAMSERYFPEVSESRNQLKTETEEFITSNTANITKLQGEISETIARLTAEKKVRKDLMDEAAVTSDTAISTATSVFDAVSSLMENKDLILTILDVQITNADTKYEAALESIRLEKTTIDENTKEDESIKNERLGVLEDKKVSLMTKKTDLDKSISSNPNRLKILQKDEISVISIEIVKELNKLNPENFNIPVDELLIENLQKYTLYPFFLKVDVYGRMLDYGEDNPFADLGYRSQLESIALKLRERKESLKANQDKTMTAQATYSKTSVLNKKEHLKNMEALKKSSAAMTKTITNARQLIDSMKLQLQTVKDALEAQRKLCNDNDKTYLADAIKTQTWVTSEEKWIFELEQETNNLVRVDEVLKIKKTITSKISETTNNLYSLAQTLKQVDKEYDKLINTYATEEEKPGFLAEQLVSRQKINDKIDALTLTISELVGQADIHKQKLDDFDSFIMLNDPKSNVADTDTVLGRARELLNEAVEFIRINTEIELKRGLLILTDNKGKLTKLETFIEDCVAIKEEKTEAANKNARLKFISNHILDQATISTTTAKQTAAIYITTLDDLLLSNPKTLGEDDFIAAKKLIVLATAAATHEIGLWDKYGINVDPIFVVTEKQGQLQNVKNVFETEQNYRVDNIKSAVESVKRTQQVEEQLKFDSAHNGSEQIKTDITQSREHTRTLYGRLNSEKAGEYMFELNKMFRKQITDIRAKLDKYKPSCEHEYVMLNANPVWGNSVTYKGKVDIFIRDTEKMLAEIETDMTLKETTYMKDKETKKTAEKLLSRAAEGKYFKDSLSTILSELEIKINSNASDYMYVNVANDIRMASIFIQGIRSFSSQYETEPERVQSYVFAAEKEEKLFSLVEEITLKKLAQLHKLQGIVLEQTDEITRRETELLKQQLLNAAEQVKIESEILRNLAIGAEEEVNTLRIKYADFIAAAFKKSEQERKEIDHLIDVEKKNIERLRLLNEEYLAAAKLKVDLEHAKQNALRQANGYESQSFMNYIIYICLFVINYLKNYPGTVSVYQLDILEFFIQFQRDSLIYPFVPETIFKNALHLVNQIISISGGTFDSVALFLFKLFEYKIAKLIYYFFRLIKNSVSPTPIKIKLPTVPTVDLSVKLELPERSVGEASAVKKDEEIPPAEVESAVKKDEEIPPAKELGSASEEDTTKPEEDEEIPPAKELGSASEEDTTKPEESALKEEKEIPPANDDDVCKNYEHLFQENYHLFVPPSTEMRGGMWDPGTNSGIGSTIFGNTTMLENVFFSQQPYTSEPNRGDTLTNIPNSYFPQGPPTPHDILGMNPLQGMDFRTPPSTHLSAYYEGAYDTYSGHFEWEDDDGNTVIELDDITPYHPPNFILDGFIDASGRVINYFTESPEEIEAKLAREKRQAIEDEANKQNADYISVRSGKTLQQKLKDAESNREAQRLKAYDVAFAKSKLAGPSEEEKKIITDFELKTKLGPETPEETEARETREAEEAQKTDDEDAEKKTYDAAVKTVSKAKNKELSSIVTLKNLISVYDAKLVSETEEETAARNARAVKKAEKDKYDAIKGKKYSVILTDSDKKIISDYNARDTETTEQANARKANEAEADRNTVTSEDNRVFHNNMLNNYRNWSGVFGLGGKVLNDGGYAFRIGQYLFSPQNQTDEIEIVSDVEKPKYFDEVTSKFLPSMTTIKTENNLSGIIDRLNLYVKDVITDGRCFSGAALYSLKLNEQRKSNPFGISWNVDFNPAEKVSDSEKLNTEINEIIIKPITNKLASKTETDLVEFVYNYHFGYEDDSILNAVFESQERNLIKSALSQLFLNEKIRDLLQKLNNLDNSFKEYDESFSLTKLFKKAPQMGDYLRLRGSGNYLPEEIKFSSYKDKKLLEHLKIKDVSGITFEVLNAELLKISDRIKTKPDFIDKYYTPYILYIQSLNKVSKLGAYPWTDPVVGPAQVIADVRQTNVVIKYESSYNQGNVVFNPRDKETNKFKEVDSTIYLLFKNMNGGSHYVALLDPEFNQEIRADAPPQPNYYTKFELNELNVNVGGKIVNNGHKGKINETDGLFVELDQWGKMPIVVAKGQRITRDFVEINPDGTIMKENGIVIKNGTMGKVDENGVFKEIPPPVDTGWTTYFFRTPVVHQFTEVYPENTYLKEREPLIDDTIYFKLYNMSDDEIEESKRNEKNVPGFKTIEGPRKAIIHSYDSIYDYDTSRYITTRPAVDNTLYFKLYNMSDDEIEESKTIEGPRNAIINGHDSIYDYDTSRYITTRPWVDDEQFFKLFNTSNVEIRKQKEKISAGLPTPIKGLRKAVINGKDAIYDYEKSEYITTGPNEPHFDLNYYDKLFKKYEKYKQYKPFMLDKRESIFANQKDEDLMYVTKTPKPMSGGDNKSLNHDYDALFQRECKNIRPTHVDYNALFEMEPEPVRKDYTDLFEMEPEPVITDYTDLFEMEPEPVITDYTDLFEMEPEPVITDYTDLFEIKPEPVITDYTDLFEIKPEPVITDYTDLFEIKPEPVITDYTDLFEMEPEPVITDYTDLFEMEPEPVITDYTDLFEVEPVRKDYTDLFEVEPVRKDYTDLFEVEPVRKDYTDLFEVEPEPEPVRTDYTYLFEMDFQ
jgi:hypothetical protein